MVKTEEVRRLEEDMDLEVSDVKSGPTSTVKVPRAMQGRLVLETYGVASIAGSGSKINGVGDSRINTVRLDLGPSKLISVGAVFVNRKFCDSNPTLITAEVG